MCFSVILCVFYHYLLFLYAAFLRVKFKMTMMMNVKCSTLSTISNIKKQIFSTAFINTLYYPQWQFPQSNSNGERLLWIGDGVLKPNMNISDGHFQIFYDICDKLFDKSVLGRIFYHICTSPLTTTFITQTSNAKLQITNLQINDRKKEITNCL